MVAKEMTEGWCMIKQVIIYATGHNGNYFTHQT